MKQGTRQRPNVLVVLADQLRGCSVGYAGEEAVRTPNLDAFAAAGAACTNAVSLLPVCGPYRGSLLTGRTPTSTGLVLNDIPLATTETSIAHCFNAAGYDTAYIGKWHLDGPNRPAPVPPGPRRQGFGYWMAANFEHNYDRSWYTDNAGERKIWPGWDAEAQTTHAIDYLRGRESDNPVLPVPFLGAAAPPLPAGAATLPGHVRPGSDRGTAQLPRRAAPGPLGLLRADHVPRRPVPAAARRPRRHGHRLARPSSCSRPTTATCTAPTACTRSSGRGTRP